jgi:amino acid adenylation domain-containing protein
VRRVALTAALSDAVRKLCLREGVTPFMALLAAWSVLLGRHAGQEDVLVGSPSAGRDRREIEDLIGFFVNTLVLRSAWDQATTFRHLLARVRSTALDAYEHQDLPFERLVEELAPERDLSRAPLFQTFFAMQTPEQSLALPGLAVTPVPLDSQVAKVDLSLSLWQEADGFAGELERSTDLFDASTAERLLVRFQTLLEAAVTDPEQPVADLPLLPAEERRQVLRQGRGRRDPAARGGETLQERFEAMARDLPDAPAVICDGGDIWSYRRLDEVSNRLARRLRAVGVGPEVAVGAAMARSPELIVGLLSILKAGGVYVPLDPAHPDERLNFMLADTGAEVVLVHAGTRERMRGRARLLDVGSTDLQTEGDGSSLGVRVPAESLAYVIYTSGSTGMPKGVGVEHGAAAAHGAAIVAEHGLGPGQRVLQFASVGFDVSLEQILPTLASGATLVLRGEDLLSPGALLPALARSGITVANLPTAYWQQTLGEWSEAAAPASLPLRLLIVGGEAMLPEAARRWATLAEPVVPGSLKTGLHLVNAYGPTETVMTATHFEIPRSGPLGISAVLLGRPLPFRTAHVLDRRGALQPVGVPGELCLGGLLARGYLNRPDLTAEKLVPDPFSEEPGARMYRTGDLVRSLPDGNLDYFGRIDRQVKVRGFRIEPGEIEAVLGSHPAVRECAVLARESSLVAYVVLDRSDRSDAKRLLTAWLRSKLPDYMVPGAMVLLDALPLTPNGKVDRKALPAPERTGMTGEGAGAPADPVEELLAGIWARVLELDRVGTHDDFFALGGHSLVAAQVASRIRSVLGVELPLRKLFELRTVAELAGAVRAARREGVAPAPPIVRRPADSPPPLSFSQQRIWFLERLLPDTAVFNVPSLYALSGLLEVAACGKALAEIVRRHEALRTTIAGPAGRPFQLVHPVPEGAPDLPVVDLSALPAEPREREAGRVVAREARRPLDPVRGPLARFLLLRAEAGDHRLLAVFHHLISDGVSQEIFARELVALHGALTAGRPFPLADLPVQYADYAVWQRQLLTGDHLAAQVAFWRERLAGPLPVIRLPTDRPRPEVPSSRGALVQTTLPAALTAAVRELSRREGSTLYITLLAAFLALLHRATGQRDLPLGTPVSYRDRPEVEGLIGMFVNTLVIRAEVAPGAGFRTHLAHVRERVLEAFGHQDVPFERLVEELRPERGLHDTPFFQLMFGLYTRPEVSLRAGGLEMHPRDLDNGTAQFELTFYMVDTRSDLVAEVEYRTELFDRTTIDRMLAAYQTLLAAAVAAPDLPVDGLPFEVWLAAAPPPAAPAAPPPARLAAVEAVAARAAQLEEKRSLLTEEQRERMRQRLRPK